MIYTWKKKMCLKTRFDYVVIQFMWCFCPVVTVEVSSSSSIFQSHYYY